MIIPKLVYWKGNEKKLFGRKLPASFILLVYYFVYGSGFNVDFSIQFYRHSVFLFLFFSFSKFSWVEMFWARLQGWMDRKEMAGNIFSDYWLSIIPLSSACVRQIFDTFRLLILALETAEWNVSLLYFCFCFAIWFVLPFDLITHTKKKETKTKFHFEKGNQIHIE